GPDEIKYYDTKSPFSQFKIIWGGQGRAITKVHYARNIDERSGFGFDYRGLFIDKQIQRSGRGDRNVRGTYYTLFGHYATKDGRYRLLANFIRNNHEVNEYGGILAEPGDPIAVYFDDNRQLSLQQAENNELRTNYHLYHQYKLNDLIEVYHEFDRYKQQNDFIDDLQDNPDYFDALLIDSADVKDRSKMVYQQHELGLKGDIGKTFYNFYYKYRQVDFDYRYLNLERHTNLDSEVGESYGGFNLRFGNDSVSYVKAYGEYMQGGNFKLGGELKNDWFHAKGGTMLYEAPYIFQAYRGTHDFWINDFDQSVKTQLEGTFHLNLGKLKLRPGLSNTLMSNYLYFVKDTSLVSNGQSVLPQQTSADINILQPQLGMDITLWKHLHFQSQLIYSLVSGGSTEAINIPDFYARGQLSYGRISFEGNLEWRIGLDAYWKSTYFADGYDPAIMQFYVQNDFEVPAFPLIDFFFEGKINRGRFFLTANNIYEIFSDTGYFATPMYPGQTTIIDFGFDWTFYD
ncbi:MAG: putative porin, partial [Fulvivirga sp.]|nr:putative porin [Fulvivirga sp.]